MKGFTYLAFISEVVDAFDKICHFSVFVLNLLHLIFLRWVSTDNKIFIPRKLAPNSMKGVLVPDNFVQLDKFKPVLSVLVGNPSDILEGR